MLFVKKKNLLEEVIGRGQKLQPELRELVIGRKTVFSLLSFGVGSVMIGNFIWNISSYYFGSFFAGLIGLVMFLVGGVIRHEFKR